VVSVPEGVIVTSPERSTPDIGHVHDPALPDPEPASAELGMPRSPDEDSPTDMPTMAARRASWWGAVWMIVVLAVIIGVVFLIIEK